MNTTFKLGLMAIAAVFSCRSRPHSVDAGAVNVSRPLNRDGGLLTVSDEQLLRWAAGVTSQPMPKKNELRSFESRARAELKWRDESGLSDQLIDDIELLVSTVVTQKRIATLTGAEAVRSFEQSSQALKMRQDAGAEFEAQRLAFEFQIRAQQSSALKMLEIQFGTVAVEAVLRNEAVLTRAWENAIEADHAAPSW